MTITKEFLIELISAYAEPAADDIVVVSEIVASTIEVLERLDLLKEAIA